MINLGQKIIELRRKNGLSASELARRAGVTRGFVSLVENNRSGMSADKLRIFAELLGVEPSELHPEESSVRDRADQTVPSCHGDQPGFCSGPSPCSGTAYG